MDIEEKIKLKILSSKKDIRLDKFITNALFDKNGYYFKKKPIGKKNDFITSPEISQMFGEIIGSYLLYIWKTKINKKFNLIELGPGNGSLFKDIVKSVSKHPYFLESANIDFIEINNQLIKIQKEISKKKFYKKINWRNKINYRSNLPSIIYSNEFFDCFPVRHFIYKKNWLERYISFDKKNNRFYFKNKSIKQKKILEFLDLYNKQSILEISLERNRYFERICNFIKNKGGLFFTIDYGYQKNISNFTLQAIQNHKFSNILEDIGNKDISSHVNFNDFLNIAKKYKLSIDEFCSQREFLTKYGILERSKKLSNNKNKYIIQNELDKLIGFEEMGSLFKFLIVSNL